MTIRKIERKAASKPVAAITGASSGIGEAVAYRLAEEGYELALLDINKQRLELVANTLILQGASVRPFYVDVADAESVNAAFLMIEEWRRAPDILVNSAGILSVVPAMECTAENFAKVMNVNVAGTFNCSQRAARGMIAQNYGRIVNLASISAERAGVGRVAYGTSKAAVAALTRQFAMELGCAGITVNSIAPGPIVTPLTESSYTVATRRAFEAMIPAKRLGTPDEVAHAIAFLCSENAAYINGVMLAVDGGYIAAGISITGDVQS
jgi:NAD(P)-dependent dehydrogenase (short-subunit alcohol dehydrogenase family)